MILQIGQKYFIAIFLSVISFFSYSDEQKNENVEMDVDKAELIIFRNKFTPPLAYKPMMKINGKRAFYLPHGYHAKLKLDPGKYTIMSDWKPLHGPSDKTVEVELKKGQSTWLKVGTSLNVFFVGDISSGMEVQSTLKEGGNKSFDLNKSRPISRWHADWVQQQTGVYGNPRHEKYDVQIDTAKVIADIEESTPQQQIEIYKYLIHHSFYEEEILIKAEQLLLENYTSDVIDETQEQWMAFMSKYLGSSRMPEFKGALIKVCNGSTDKKIKRYARRFLKGFYDVDVKQMCPKEKKKS